MITFYGTLKGCLVVVDEGVIGERRDSVKLLEDLIGLQGLL